MGKPIGFADRIKDFRLKRRQTQAECASDVGVRHEGEQNKASRDLADMINTRKDEIEKVTPPHPHGDHAARAMDIHRRATEAVQKEYPELFKKYRAGLGGMVRVPDTTRNVPILVKFADEVGKRKLELLAANPKLSELDAFRQATHEVTTKNPQLAEQHRKNIWTV